MTFSSDHDVSDGQWTGIKLPEPTAAAVSAWMSELPLANSAFCFEAVAALLESFNARADLPAAVRFELAELLRPTVLMLAQRCEVHFIDSSLPYPAEAEFHAFSNLRLQYELSRAYTLIGLDPAFSGQWTPKAVYLALLHWGQVRLIMAQIYRPPDEDFWRSVYSLHQVSESCSLSLREFGDEGECGPLRTPLDLFLRMVLFSISNPQRFRQRDIAMIFGLLGKFLSHVRWDKTAEDGDRFAEFRVDLAGAQPPVRHSAAKPVPGDAGFRYLFTRRLAQALIKACETGVGLEAREMTSKALVIRVARSLAGADKRKYSRIAEDGICCFVVGLGGISAALNQPELIAPKLPEPASGLKRIEDWSPPPNFELTPVENSGLVIGFEGRSIRTEVGLKKYFGNRGPRRTASEDIWNARRGRAAATATPAQRQRIVLIDGHIVNSGPRGYCIVWTAGPEASAKIGELIGIAVDQAPLHIGVIRWLSCDSGKTRIGVELLAPDARVIDLAGDSATVRGQGLLLPMDPVLRPVPELLAPPSVLRIGGVIEVNLGSLRVAYQVQGMIEATPAFGRFSLVQLHSSVQGQTDKTG